MWEKPNAALAARLRELKDLCDLSYQELGDAIGITRYAAFEYLDAKIRIPADRLAALAAAFGCDVRYLLMPPGSPLPKVVRQFRKPLRRVGLSERDVVL